MQTLYKYPLTSSGVGTHSRRPLTVLGIRDEKCEEGSIRCKIKNNNEEVDIDLVSSRISEMHNDCTCQSGSMFSAEEINIELTGDIPSMCSVNLPGLMVNSKENDCHMVDQITQKYIRDPMYQHVMVCKAASNINTMPEFVRVKALLTEDVQHSKVGHMPPPRDWKTFKSETV